MKKPYQPYQYFKSRDELYDHFVRQCIDRKVTHFLDDIKDAVYDERWNPLTDYNGCSVNQDPLHPFAPCFLHDYAWVVLKGTDKNYKKHDKAFYNRLKEIGVCACKAKRWYLGVRIGWFFMIKLPKLLSLLNIKNKPT